MYPLLGQRFSQLLYLLKQSKKSIAEVLESINSKPFMEKL